MEELMLKYVPDLFDELESILVDVAQFFGAGLLIAVMLWVIGYTVISAYGFLRQASS